jgi:hypothetical protein
MPDQFEKRSILRLVGRIRAPRWKQPLITIRDGRLPVCSGSAVAGLLPATSMERNQEVYGRLIRLFFMAIGPLILLVVAFAGLDQSLHDSLWWPPQPSDFKILCESSCVRNLGWTGHAWTLGRSVERVTLAANERSWRNGCVHSGPANFASPVRSTSTSERPLIEKALEIS